MKTAQLTINTLKDKKQNGQKISMVTAYDYPSAKVAEEAGLDMILVGDSLGMTVLGYETTIPVTMDEMIYHCKAVRRGAPQSFIVGDMPFLSYQVSPSQAIANAGRFLQEAGMQAVKLEGGKDKAETIRAIVSVGIPVIGHLGLTPQSVHQLGGYKVQGKELLQAEQILEDAIVLEQAGVCALVLECIPALLAKSISEALTIPTIGIGAGVYCDGQVLVWHDLLGITTGAKTRFVKRYADLNHEMLRALKLYKQEVEQGKFPLEEHSFSMNTEVIAKVQGVETRCRSLKR